MKCHQLCVGHLPSCFSQSVLNARQGDGGGACLYLLSLSHPGKRAVVGYEDGTMRIWDLKQGTSLHVLKGKEEGTGLSPGLLSSGQTVPSSGL